MKLFAVTVYVEAEDVVDAIEMAGDVWVDVGAVQRMAALGQVKVRPARKDEVPR